ncbi:MAG: hypothetical protein KC502_19215 [Myxococcales bacterium]|nr:hypothetical protein [Myxococcales bacterium]
MTTRALLILGFLFGAAACGGEDGDVTPVDTSVVSDANATTDGEGSADSAAGLPISVSAADFDCLTKWTKVRRFRIKSLNGQLDAALKIANSPTGGTYPPGTVIQLIPTEAMVKHEKGWSDKTNDWEFFFLKMQAGKTVIGAQGTTDVINGFGGNCFDCHAKADPKWDLVCEQDHGCTKLPFSAEIIASLQEADSRCKK